MKGSHFAIMLGVVVLLAGLLFLAVKSCNDKKAVEASYTQKQMDSVRAVLSQSEVVIDSLVSRINKQSGEKDSLKNVTVEKDRELAINAVKLKSLAEQAKMRKEYKDTAKYVSACDSLLPALDNYIAQSDSLRVEYMKLNRSYDSLLGTNSLYISRLEFDREFLRGSLADVAGHAVDLENKNKRSEKKANKKIAAGPQFGATYSEGKVRPYAGFGVTWIFARL